MINDVLYIQSYLKAGRQRQHTDSHQKEQLESVTV